MRRTTQVARAVVPVFVLVLVVGTGCAGAPKTAPASVAGAPAATPQAESAAPTSTPGAAASTVQADPADKSDAARAPKTEPLPRPSNAPEPATSGAETPKAAGRSSAGVPRAVTEEGTEIDRAQRELDVAGGNCPNACRALGSMDRATGRLCGLARSDDDHGRCSDASTKLKKARDRVKRTCGSCPDVSVERDSAIPSR